MWHYNVPRGWLDKDGVLISKNCYSGFQEGRNNPSYEAIHDVGPIPQGVWIISGPPFDSPDHGPYVLRLTPANGTITFGRDGFLIHGDSESHPGEASKGCLIADRTTRTRIYQSGDTNLTVFTDQEKQES